MTELPTAEHWYHRVAANVRAWLDENPRSALTGQALDAVIGAGGVPVPRRDSSDPASELHYLDAADAEYIEELRRAGEPGD